VDLAEIQAAYYLVAATGVLVARAFYFKILLLFKEIIPIIMDYLPITI